MQVDLVTGGRLVDVVVEGFDLGLRPADLVPRDKIALLLGTPQRCVVVASPAWIAAHPVPLTPADLPSEECIRARLSNGALFRWAFERGGGTEQIEPKGRLTLDEAGIGRTAVLKDAGIGFFIEQDVADDIAAGRMVRLLEIRTPPRPAFSLYSPGRRNPSAGFTALLSMVREVAARHTKDGGVQ